MNKELLQDVPYKIVFDDLAVTFHVLLGSTRDGIESFMINNRLFYSFEIDIEELYISALHNSKAYFMTSIRNINDVMADVVADKGSCNRKRCYDCISLEEGQGAMYVLSNNIGIYGATVLLYSNIVREIAETMNSDIYILPSSIHEVILVLDYGLNIDVNRLKNIVYEINRKALKPEDFLSNSVYMYRRATGEIRKL